MHRKSSCLCTFAFLWFTCLVISQVAFALALCVYSISGQLCYPLILFLMSSRSASPSPPQVSAPLSETCPDAPTSDVVATTDQSSGRPILDCLHEAVIPNKPTSSSSRKPRWHLEADFTANKFANEEDAHDPWMDATTDQSSDNDLANSDAVDRCISVRLSDKAFPPVLPGQVDQVFQKQAEDAICQNALSREPVTRAPILLRELVLCESRHARTQTSPPPTREASCGSSEESESSLSPYSKRACVYWDDDKGEGKGKDNNGLRMQWKQIEWCRHYKWQKREQWQGFDRH